jgi:hypothetical protein
MADMAVVIGGNAADVELDMPLFNGPEGFLGPGQGIVYFDGHGILFANVM